MKRLFIPFLMLLIAGIGCNNAEKETAQTTTTSETEQVQTVADTDQEPQVEPKVTLVKFSDYQCPACAVYYSFEKQLKQDLGDDVLIITKHFPLNQHPYAHLASRAVEAAKVQGKKHEMHDLIFVGQSQWSRGNAEAIFIGYAKSLGLDEDKFVADMNSADMNRIVMEQRREGIEKQIRSTPTFFINGEMIENNPPNYEQFKKLVLSYM